MDIAVATRPVQPDDLPRFARLWPRLSRETVYRRFHSPVHYLPPELVLRLVSVDHDRREALVAMSGDEVIGVARYDRSPTDATTAEVAILVEDAWQGMGVGRQLLTELSELAASRGVHTLTAAVQEDNDRMVAMIRRLLPGSAFRVDEHVYSVLSPLRIPPGPHPPRRPSLPPAAEPPERTPSWAPCAPHSPATTPPASTCARSGSSSARWPPRPRWSRRTRSRP